ncbi:hypothetical protein BJ684DRAFT_20476 [Piptocephalis cylindrospora]|uniref:Citrate transporter-like domain-containing protein n=1 Tax=Piptocephalis cylindrospora TaxID=1907219 RepID=A0A4P9Y2E6_9FUNG|nr:hypothetical protein BJ684DRAFT_20476 [Piptocephalis cylindrospora]|eukprot:RKP13007.1 hypothetical protein BJ684DRAFT_20476 [Piptocephalis cylindrospora]
MIALLPLIAFFGSGILGKEDLHRLPWPVVVLAMGGMALGKAVSSSGLLSTVAQGISGAIGGVSLWSLVWLFSVIIGVIATFVSHTVTAMVLLPVVAEVGANLSEPHPKLLIMTTMFICSVAMGLPVSGFPNMTAVMTEDEHGRTYLRTTDFLKVGIPTSILCIIGVCTVGHVICVWLGF